MPQINDFSWLNSSSLFMFLMISFLMKLSFISSGNLFLKSKINFRNYSFKFMC